MDKQFKDIDYVIRFSNFEVINSEFTRCRCNIFYTGRNRKYTDITKEALQKLIDRKGFANIPVVGHLYEEDGQLRLGGHDRKLQIDNNGMQIINECQAFGLIPESCNPSIDKIVEKSGETKEYFSTDVILWSHYFPVMDASFNDEVYFNQSMEISINDYDYDGDYTVIKDFTLQALCLLNLNTNDKDKNVEPCFESSRVKRFEMETSNFQTQFELLKEKYKAFEADTNKSATNNKNIDEKKGEYYMNKDVIEKLSTFMFKNQLGNDVNKYAVLDMTDEKVNVIDLEDSYKVFSIDYTVVDENETKDIVFDFDHKVECSLTATEKREEENFSIVNEINTNVTALVDSKVDAEVDRRMTAVTEEFNSKYDEINNLYTTTLNSLHKANERLNEYAKEEELAKKEQHKKDIDSLLEEYSKKIDKYPKFLIYKSKVIGNYDAFDYLDVQRELTLMVGEAMMKQTDKKNYAYNPTATGVNMNSGFDNSSSTNRYGNLFDKFKGMK